MKHPDLVNFEGCQTVIFLSKWGTTAEARGGARNAISGFIFFFFFFELERVDFWRTNEGTWAGS